MQCVGAEEKREHQIGSEWRAGEGVCLVYFALIQRRRAAADNAIWLLPGYAHLVSLLIPAKGHRVQTGEGGGASCLPSFSALHRASAHGELAGGGCSRSFGLLGKGERASCRAKTGNRR